MKNAPRFSVGDQVYVVCDVSGDETRPPCYAEQYLKPYTISKGEIVAVRKPSAEQPYPYEVDIPSEDCVVDSTEELVATTLAEARILAKESERLMRETLRIRCLPVVLAWALLALPESETCDVALALAADKSPMTRTYLKQVAGSFNVKSLHDGAQWGVLVRNFWHLGMFDRASVVASVRSTLRLMAKHAGCVAEGKLVLSLPKECQVKGEHLLLQEVLQILKAALPLHHAQAMARGLGTRPA